MWDDMVDVFCTKYFHGEETVMFATLQGTKQKNCKDLMEYIKRFRDIALDCYDHYEEKTLVEICMGNMIMEYRAILKKARRTAQSVRSSSDKPEEWRSTPQAMAVSINEKKRKSDGREYENPQPLPCTPKELDMLLDKWIADGIFKPNQVSREPIEEECRDPRFCCLHNYVQHPTVECWAFHRLVHHRIREGTFELS